MVAHVTHPKVLVIDDEHLFRDMLHTVLEDEYDVLTAESADIGLRLLEANRPDAVLLDLVMPGRDGIQGLKAIREIDPDVAVIIITGYARLETAEQAMELGANAYVEKPVEPDDLIRTIRRNVERSHARKREHRITEEMRGMLVELSREHAREKELASQAEAALELMHDIKYPLKVASEQLRQLEATINLRAKTEHPDALKDHKSVSLVRNAIDQCRLLTAMCRALTHKEDIPFEDVSIPELVTTVLDELTPWATTAGVKLDFRMYARDGVIRGQRVQLHRALRTLVGNAIDASAHSQSVVRVFCSPQADRLEIRVEDHGAGYSMEELARTMGSRFSNVAVRNGSGIGLALSRKIITDHGGRLRVQTAEGKGSVVFVSLPVTG